MYKEKTTELRMEEMEIPAARLGKESSLPDLSGEKILQNSLFFCLDEEDEIFEGYGRQENAYPYRQYNAYGKDLNMQQVKTIILENRYLKAVFLPEYGGRLWSLTDKKTGKNLLYTNDVLQFRNLAVRNAWFSGGVEWNIGIIGHSPFTTAPLYVATLEDEAGNPVLRMYEYERIRKVCYQMDFWLEEEDTFLNCRMRIVNENNEVIPMYWWSNMAVPEFEGGRIIVPADRAFTFEKDKVIKTDLPMVNSVDVTHYNEIPKSVDYFFDIEENNPKYIANINKNGYGLLQLSTSRLRGRKLFSWGHSKASKHWQEFLTKDAGDYIEIQAGLGKTQYGCLPMAPHTAWEWIEQYGPVQLGQEQLNLSNKENSKLLSEQLKQSGRISALEKKLRDTKNLAKKSGKILMAGSGYGAFRNQGNSTRHLQFILEKESLKNWEKFRNTGLLHEPEPMTPPDEFWNDDEIFTLLKNTIKDKNSQNWYAHYQLGINYYIRKNYKKAKKEWKESYELKNNPWACHGLGCNYFMKGKKKKAIFWLVQGIMQRTEDISYLKECFKLLVWCEGYQEIIQCFESLNHKETSRLKFYYIYAKSQLGAYEEAFRLLEENGGLIMEDIREGEDSVEQLWARLNKITTGKDMEVPYRYVFKAL